MPHFLLYKDLAGFTDMSLSEAPTHKIIGSDVPILQFSPAPRDIVKDHVLRHLALMRIQPTSHLGRTVSGIHVGSLIQDGQAVPTEGIIQFTSHVIAQSLIPIPMLSPRGDQHQACPRLIRQPLQESQSRFIDIPLLRGLFKIITLGIQHAVDIQKNNPHERSSPPSARRACKPMTSTASESVSKG